MKDFIESQINDLKQFINGLLPDYNDVTLPQATKVFLAYDKVIRTNFLLWLMLTSSWTKTPKSRAVVKDNLQCEIGQNHPQMLLNVMVDVLHLYANPMLHRRLDFLYSEVDKALTPKLHEVNKLTYMSNSLNGFYIMAALENMSLVFIPWMKEVAQHRLNVKNLEYFYIHGEADIQHATDFTEAFVGETKRILNTSKSNSLEERHKASIREITYALQSIFTTIFSFAKKD